MEAPKLQDAVIEIDAEGTLHGDDAVLTCLEGMQFQVRFQGSSSRWEPTMNEIVDLAERMQAQQEWAERLNEAMLLPKGTLPDG